MAVIKCKMCGGNLDIVEGISFTECEYCGSKQTIPNPGDEKKLARFARAERLRRANEFDRATEAYENIVADFPDEPEAYWGLVLCRYGIEYVDDPATREKVPTCHRFSFASVLEDPDFEEACDHADPAARRIYRDEAKTIERILKQIQEVSTKEKPYDIFICYKETDEKGNRTLDSVIAQDVYDALIKKGYRVFFSRISLEDKLGKDYEPYIFAALNSAKIMLVFGTDFEHLNAVWVKNEWSRFLTLAEKNAEKVLIPCFKNIDAYDMPREFQRLQGQDMGKVGAIQDLLRGIDKIIAPSSSIREKAEDEDGDYVNYALEMIEQGNLALDEEEWEEAYDCFADAIIESDSDQTTYFPAYLGRLCAELRLKNTEQLRSGDPRVDEEHGFDKFICSADTKAGYIMLGQRKWTAADALFSRALESDSRYAPVYLGKFMASYKISKEEEIPETFLMRNLIIADDKNFQKALRYADDSLRTRLNNYQKESTSKPVVSLRKDLEEIRSERSKYKGRILATSHNTYALSVYGGVLAAGDNQEGQCNTGRWREITAIDAGFCHVAGLKKDGTVVAVGAKTDFINDGQCNTENWSGIKSITAGGSWTIGVKQDGSIAVCGSAIHNKNDLGSGYWKGAFKNVVGHVLLPNSVEFERVFAASKDFYGLQKDKTVMAYNTYSACRDWKNIVDIASSQNLPHVIGLRSDGTVAAYGENECGECNVDQWTNIVAAAVGGEDWLKKYFTVGLRSDGTVVAVGDNENGQCKTSGWRDIVAIAAGAKHTVGLRADGTVVAVGVNEDGQCDTQDWQGIVAISAGDKHTVGLKKDGTVVAVGSNQFGQCDTQGWEEIITENPEKAAVRAKEEEARERRSKLMAAKAAAESNMKEVAVLRNRLKQDYSTYSICLHCGKKHLLEVTTCKQCGAMFEKGIGKRGIPFRKYLLPNHQGGCQIFQDGFIDLLQRDSSGKTLKRRITQDNKYFEYYVDDREDRIGEIICIDVKEGTFYILPEQKDGLVQFLRKDCTAEFFYQPDGKTQGICEIVSPDGFVSTVEYRDGKIVK